MAKIETMTLPVEGMTCASCVVRVEKALKYVAGVSGASVNLASEKATVTFDAGLVSVEELARAVGEEGYSLTLPTAAPASHAPTPEQALRRDLALSVILTVPVVSLSMLSMLPSFRSLWPLSVGHTNILLFFLTAPVLLIAGRRFFRGLGTAIRHRNADMNTLVAVGTGSAFLYS